MRTVHINASTPYDVLIGAGLVDRWFLSGIV